MSTFTSWVYRRINSCIIILYTCNVSMWKPMHVWCMLCINCIIVATKPQPIFNRCCRMLQVLKILLWLWAIAGCCFKYSTLQLVINISLNIVYWVKWRNYSASEKKENTHFYCPIVPCIHACNVGMWKPMHVW